MPANAGTAKQQAVVDLARLLGWSVATFRPALTKRGWRTPVGGDGAGFPDLLMVRGDRLLVREVKSGRATTTAEQNRFLDCHQHGQGVCRCKDMPVHDSGICPQCRKREAHS